MTLSTMERNSVQEKKLRSRDIFDFVQVPTAEAPDDKEIGDLLVRVFTQTYAQKLPQQRTVDARILDLYDVQGRRAQGTVLVLELGFKLLGTVSILQPNSSISQSWKPNSANLRCLAIAQEFHGLGFSHLLLDAAERAVADWRVQAICLHVQQGANGVAGLYQGRGYVREPSGDLNCHGDAVLAYALALPR